MITAVGRMVPEVLSLVTCTYGSPSFLIFGEDIILSLEGKQQGEPSGHCSFASLFTTWSNGCKASSKISTLPMVHLVVRSC